MARAKHKRELARLANEAGLTPAQTKMACILLGINGIESARAFIADLRRYAAIQARRE